jgi:trigger factor
LKIETQAREDCQMQVSAEFETSDLEKYKHQAARRIAQRAKIPGFRPGKAPYEHILRYYGDEAIEEEAINLMVEDVYPQILTEAKIEPSAPGMLEDISKKDPLKFTFVIPLLPETDLAGYKDMRKKYTLKPVAKKEVDEFIERLRKNFATAEPVERPAEMGDLVYVKLDAVILNPSEKDKPELLKDSPLQVVIGDTDPEKGDFPYTGFGDNLLKCSANDEKVVKYTYPEDSRYEQLRGKDVEFHAKVESVKTLHLPDFDDAFAQTVGDFENVEKLRESIKDQLESRARDEYESTWYEELIDEVIAQSKIKYPSQMIEHEMEHIVEDITEDLAKQKMELDTYLKTIKKEKTAWLEEDIKPVAKKRLERSLAMEQLAKAEDIQVKNEDLQDEVSAMINEMQMQGNMDLKKLEKQLKNERVANNFTMQAASRLVNRKTLERLKDIVTGKAQEAPAADAAVEAPKAKTAAKKKADAAVETEEPKAKPAAKKAAPKAEKAETAAVEAEPVKVKKAAKKAADDKEA